MAESEIDTAILSCADPAWKKVALVISQTSQRIQGQLPDNGETRDSIAARIESLVAQGRLLGKGNLHHWRQSEIRRPG